MEEGIKVPWTFTQAREAAGLRKPCVLQSQGSSWSLGITDQMMGRAAPRAAGTRVKSTCDKCVCGTCQTPSGQRPHLLLLSPAPRQAHDSISEPALSDTSLYYFQQAVCMYLNMCVCGAVGVINQPKKRKSPHGSSPPWSRPHPPPQPGSSPSRQWPWSLDQQTEEFSVATETGETLVFPHILCGSGGLWAWGIASQPPGQGNRSIRGTHK